MSDPAPSPDGSALLRYEAIGEHAELELELAGRGEVTLLAELSARWDELVAGLPEQPPAAAAPLLERALMIHERTRIDLIRLKESLLGAIAETRRASRAASGYAGTLPHARPRVDRSA